MSTRELEERRRMAESQISRLLEFLEEVPGLQGENLERHLGNIEIQSRLQTWT